MSIRVATSVMPDDEQGRLPHFRRNLTAAFFGNYDLVSLRLMLSAIEEGNLVKVASPGGHLLAGGYPTLRPKLRCDAFGVNPQSSAASSGP